MRRDRKNNIRRERIIMIASSAFVLAALTLTGVYMKEKNMESEEDGYSVDFEALEDNVDDKYQEIAQNTTDDLQDNLVAQGDLDTTPGDSYIIQGDSGIVQGDSVAENGLGQTNMENDLDYMPMEAGSNQVEIPGLTDGSYNLPEEDILAEEDLLSLDEDVAPEGDKAASAQNIVVTKELNFSEGNGLIRPVSGEVLMHYSMDGSIYFATLDQYKYNPAVMFSAEEGTAVTACAEGKVVKIDTDAQIGRTVTIDLGNGYKAIYGQLKDVAVSVDSYVNPGDTIGVVAAPTKYYSVEGANLYFQLTKDDVSVNPENMF